MKRLQECVKTEEGDRAIEVEGEGGRVEWRCWVSEWFWISRGGVGVTGHARK